MDQAIRLRRSPTGIPVVPGAQSAATTDVYSNNVHATRTFGGGGGPGTPSNRTFFPSISTLGVASGPRKQNRRLSSSTGTIAQTSSAIFNTRPNRPEAAGWVAELAGVAGLGAVLDAGPESGVAAAGGGEHAALPVVTRNARATMDPRLIFRELSRVQAAVNLRRSAVTARGRRASITAQGR